MVRPSAGSRRALVTGGTKGLGLAIVRQLVGDGLQVVATYARDDATAAKIREESSAHGASGAALVVERCDAARSAEVEALFARTGSAGFDVLVHALDIGQPLFKRIILALYHPEKRLLQFMGDRPRAPAPDEAVINLANGRQFGRCAREERLVGDIQLIA